VNILLFDANCGYVIPSFFRYVFNSMLDIIAKNPLQATRYGLTVPTLSVDIKLIRRKIVKIEYREMGVPPRFWGIQPVPYSTTSKNVGWIKAKRAPKSRGAKDSQCYVVKLRGVTWPHPGNSIVKAGIMTDYATFWSLDEAKCFVEEKLGEINE